MQENHITQLLAVHENKYVGIVHLHNLIQEGLL
jgi:arabinose-5-phosphate isomerase